jgi:hypothetical protein
MHEIQSSILINTRWTGLDKKEKGKAALLITLIILMGFTIVLCILFFVSPLLFSFSRPYVKTYSDNTYSFQLDAVKYLKDKYGVDYSDSINFSYSSADMDMECPKQEEGDGEIYAYTVTIDDDSSRSYFQVFVYSGKKQINDTYEKNIANQELAVSLHRDLIKRFQASLVELRLYSDPTENDDGYLVVNDSEEAVSLTMEDLRSGYISDPFEDRSRDEFFFEIVIDETASGFCSNNKELLLNLSELHSTLPCQKDGTTADFYILTSDNYQIRFHTQDGDICVYSKGTDAPGIKLDTFIKEVGKK